MIISQYQYHLHFSGHFGFGGNFKCFLVISLAITGEKIDLAHDKKTIQFYIKKHMQFYMILGSLGWMNSTTYIFIWQVFWMFFVAFACVLAGAIVSGIWKKLISNFIYRFCYRFPFDRAYETAYIQVLTSSLAYTTEITIVTRQLRNHTWWKFPSNLLYFHQYPWILAYPSAWKSKG